MNQGTSQAPVMECEVLVIGSGAAGAVSAITAHDEGADVLLIEKMPILGGNCLYTGGNICTPTDFKFFEYLNKLAFKTVNTEITEVFTREAMKNADWLRKMGGDVVVYAPLQVAYPIADPGAGFPHLGGAEYMVKYNVKAKEGEELPPGPRLWRLLSENLEKRNIKCLTGTPAVELTRNETGRVIGVIAEKDDGKMHIKAKKAVVLASGGYENDPPTKWDNYGSRPVTFLGNPGNTGDGLRMAGKLGAGMWHMTNMICSIGFQSPKYEASFPLIFFSTGFIFVDKYGKRFMAESGTEVHEYGRGFSFFDTYKVEFPRIPAWVIFDERVRRMGPLCTGTAGYNRTLYNWSMDNSAEIDKGWILKANKIGDLAKKISIDSDTLEKTVAEYNKNCDEVKDPFGRPKETLTTLKGPYYAMQIWPTVFCTQGGPHRDKEARILDTFGQPIPGLYAAGEIGSVTGYMYQGGINLSECLVFGQIAGRNAAAEISIDQE